MDISICNETNDTLERIIDHNVLVLERGPAVSENTKCAFVLHLAREERAEFEILIDNEPLETLAARKIAGSGKFTLLYAGPGDEQYHTAFQQWFESKSGSVRLEIRRRLLGSPKREVICRTTVCVDPVKMGGMLNLAQASRTLEQSPFPSLFKSCCPLLPNWALWEKYVFVSTCKALEVVGGLKLTPVIMGWDNPVEGSDFTTGPVLMCDLGTNQRLRVRHEPLVKRIGTDNRSDELYTIYGNDLRPDIAIEILELEHGKWTLKAVVIGDVKYTEDADQTRLHKWRDVDHSYAHIVTAHREAIRQLWLIPSGSSFGLKDGPRDGMVFGTTYTEDHVFASRGFSRKQLVLQPAEGCEKHFAAFAASALDALLEGRVA